MIYMSAWLLWLFICEDPKLDLDWMQFRGPNGAGYSHQVAAIPNQLNEQNVIWKVDAPAGHSSPIVVNECIALTGFDSNQLSTICFDARTGSRRWQKKIDVAKLESLHPQHGPASCSAVSDGHRIVSLFGSFGTIAYDLDGNELWRRERPVEKNMFGSASSPIVFQGRLLTFHGNESYSHLESIDIATGKLIWERKREGPASSWSTPCILHSESGPTILFYEPYHLRACSWDGQDLWSVPNLADEPITIPQIGHGLVYTTSYNLRTNREAMGLPAFDELLKQCDANHDQQIDVTEAKSNKSILSRPDADGQGDHPLRMFFRMLDENKDGFVVASEWPRIHKWMDPWKHANGLIAIRPATADAPEMLVWENPNGVSECPTPIVVDGRIYMVRNGGWVTCVDAIHGKTVFQKRLAGGGPYYASPVTANNKLCLASARGQLTILDVANADDARLIDSFSVGEAIYATPALSRWGLVVRSEISLWRFDTPLRQ